MLNKLKRCLYIISIDIHIKAIIFTYNPSKPCTHANPSPVYTLTYIDGKAVMRSVYIKKLRWYKLIF